MTKIKIIIICVSILALVVAPRNVSADQRQEPSFHSSMQPNKTVSNSNIELAMSNNGLDQIGHGLLVLTIVGFLALRKR